MNQTYKKQKSQTHQNNIYKQKKSISINTTYISKKIQTSVHLNKVTLGIFLEGPHIITHNSLELIAHKYLFQIKQLIIELNLIIIEEVVDAFSIGNRVLDDVAVFGEVNFQLFGGEVFGVFGHLNHLFDVAVDVVDDDEAPWEDLLDELAWGLDFDFAVVVCPADLHY
jgi:hypothetical protein